MTPPPAAACAADHAAVLRRMLDKAERRVANLLTKPEKEHHHAAEVHANAAALRAALAALPVATPPDAGWRGMETAPRDGTEVLLGKWINGHWITKLGDPGSLYARHAAFTHWHPQLAPPLPAPPAGATP